jgi:two-component system, NtrC family, sensor kinase
VTAHPDAHDEQSCAATAQLLEANKMASLGRLLAGIVHEINSPIGSILSNNEVAGRLLERLATAVREGRTADALETAEVIRGLGAVDKLACERISSIVRGLKIFVRSDPAEWQKADLNELLRDTLRLTACQFRRRIAVETDFGELPAVECHPHMMNQVFLNILVNAGQAIEGEGKITITTRAEPDSAHVAIGDTGPGIAPEYAARVFSPGFSTKPMGAGAGLGLSISRQIVVETHGGTLSFESRPGEGTIFHIRIPIEQPRPGNETYRS